MLTLTKYNNQVKSFYEKYIERLIYIIPVYIMPGIVGSNNFSFMVALDNLIKKIGNDKTLHFLGGCSICSLISFVAILQENGLTPWQKISLVLIGTVFVLILSVLKELIADDEADWYDVLSAVLGCIPVFVCVGLGAWFNQLS